MRTLRISIMTAIALAVSASQAFAVADGPDYWKVANVRADDVLNLHTEPSARSPTIAGIPHDATGLKNLGCTGVPTFQQWQSMSPAQRIRAAQARWCKVTYRDRTGWVAGRFLAEGPAPDKTSRRAEIGPWSLRCPPRGCFIQQAGIAASRPTLMRIEPQEFGNARIIIERKGLPRKGTVTFYIDGDLITAGPLAQLRSTDGNRLVMEPGDITLGLLKRMERGKNMVVSMPGDERGIEFHLDDLAKARDRLAK